MMRLNKPQRRVYFNDERREYFRESACSFPDVGKWINLKIGDSDFKYKILGYGSKKSVDWYPYSDGNYIIDLEKLAHVNHAGGDEDWLEESYFEDHEWEYIEDPTEEELFKAKSERKNNMLGYKCNYCDAKDRNLLKCSGCNEVRYCNQDCQGKDWQEHKKDCRKSKLVRRPNPRYPLADVNEDIANAQRAKQEKLNEVLKDAFTGRFKVLIDEEWKTNPKSTDLHPLDKYKLVTLANHDYTYYFKWRALETAAHSTPPGSCCFYMSMETWFEEEGFKEGGLHFLVDFTKEPGLFWGMALNFNTFGTIAPFNANCHCKFPKMPPIYKKLEKKWNKIFSRAKEDITDVQCMFADTKEGCHSFGLPEDLGCKFKHDILAEKESE